MITNFFLYSTSWAIYSRNRENGGLVTTISDCFSNAMLSALRKSPSRDIWKTSIFGRLRVSLCKNHATTSI